jgi:diguanylate cyclase (GGDEF)-like protein
MIALRQRDVKGESLLLRYGAQLGLLGERRSAEAGLMAARHEAERQAQRAEQALRDTEKTNHNLLLEMECRQQAQSRLEHLANHDPLTDLPNRALFAERLSREMNLARRNGTKLALMYLDLDHFKDVNDTLGHAVGDELLLEVARRLSGCLREEDMVARLGGDEFAILQTGLRDAHPARVLAQRLIAVLARPMELAERQIFTGGSIGVTLFPDDGEDAQLLQRNADLAMYSSKQERNAFHFFDAVLDDEVHRRAFLEQALRDALPSGQLSLVYQPQVSVSTGLVTGVEALLRWTHPERGAIGPDDFIPLAERCGLINEIGNWVLHEACRQAKRWDAEGLPPLTMAVNVSVNQFKTGDVPRDVAAVLAATGLAPSRLELEVTETGLMNDMRNAGSTLSQLRNQGVGLAIDDFGTGYSSLSYLRSLPVDRIKIDRSFVRDVTSNEDAAIIAGTIVNLAKSLKLDVIAEGVETLAHADFLRGAGCVSAQGFYYGRPAGADELSRLLSGRGAAEAYCVRGAA